jgi:hypothetical protein
MYSEQRCIVAYLDLRPGKGRVAAGAPHGGDIAVRDTRRIGRVVTECFRQGFYRVPHN